MVALTIDLQEGFDDDEVVIVIDGCEVFRKMAVCTRYQISLADQVALDVRPGQKKVQVSLPQRNVRGEIELDPLMTPYLGVSFDQGRLLLKPTPEAFGYL